MLDELPVPDRFRPALTAIVDRLVAGDYAGVARDHSPYRDDPDHDLGLWAREYPATFVPLPPAAWEHATALQLDAGWAVDVSLWSREEGLSDMTLSTFIREHDGEIQVDVTDLHVL
ncbi:hypothetical protein AB0J72_18790 [Dactylosporangium sp. NPDC049742]|uniref:DUF7668 domain-containing protein n=1 Tax=Dactylosporangium sp. NPDC049742 TaxID=3154737 RepID=UPI00343408D8